NDQWAPVHEWAKKRGVPFFGGEVGIAHQSGGNDQLVSYLNDMEALLEGWSPGGAAGRCQALCWTSRDARGGDYRLDADPVLLSQYRVMANKALYAAFVPPVA